jgi:predicted RNase H-like nuclease (RuvC/YqgF family)
VTLSATAITGAVAANSVQAAPAGLAAAITTAVLSGTTITTTAVIAATKAIAMTTLQKTIVASAVAVLAGAGIYEANQAANGRAAVQSLQQRQTPLTEQLHELQRERDDATNKIASLTDAITQLRRNATDLLKLRGEIGRLRADDSTMRPALDWKARVDKLRTKLDQMPGQRIPQLQFLVEDDWFAVTSPIVSVIF